MVIVAKGRDVDGIYFRYLDPGAKYGANKQRKLHIKENLVIKGDCFYRENDKYYLVEIRLEDKILPSCIIDPEVDPLIVKRRNDYDKKNKKNN